MLISQCLVDNRSSYDVQIKLIESTSTNCSKSCKIKKTPITSVQFLPCGSWDNAFLHNFVM